MDKTATVRAVKSSRLKIEANKATQKFKVIHGLTNYKSRFVCSDVNLLLTVFACMCHCFTAA